MDIEAYQKWISDFYRKRNWYQYDVFIRSNFLIEEVGELAQAIRKREIGRDRPDELFQSDVENLEDIKEELGDVLDNIFILADKYGISLEEIAQTHQENSERDTRDHSRQSDDCGWQAIHLAGCVLPRQGVPP